MSKSKNRSFNIVKSMGHLEPFSHKKLLASIQKTGLPKSSCNEIAQKVTDVTSEGARTKDIYKNAFKLVRRVSPIAAVHYSLKQAILQLGPTGYFFEIFVARYFKEIGYRTNVGLTLRGLYVNHEVDVVARNRYGKVCVECKFHNRPGVKNDVKTALYVKARWDDIKQGPSGRDLQDFFLASNTSFTKDAMTYAEGTGLKLLGLNAPVEKPFIDEIKNLKLYPVTSIKRLRKNVIAGLLENDVILAREILNQRLLLKKLGMEEDEIDLLFADVANLLQGNL